MPSILQKWRDAGRDWVRLALGADALTAPVVKVGTWWNADHQLDIVGLDESGRIALAGESKWRNSGFDWDDLETYLAHLGELRDRVRPDVTHVLFRKSGFDRRVQAWASERPARLLAPAEMLAPF